MAVSGKLGRTRIGRPTLQLQGNSDDLAAIQSDLGDRDGFVHGRLLSFGHHDPLSVVLDDRFTLFGPCSQTWDLPPDTRSEIDFEAETVMFGFHFSEEPRFNTCRLKLDLLSVVVQRPLIEVAGERDESGRRLTVDVPGWDMTVDTAVGEITIIAWLTEARSVSSLSLETSVGITVRAKEPLAMARWVTDIVDPVRYLVAFLSDLAPSVTELIFEQVEDSPPWPIVEVRSTGLGVKSEYTPDQLLSVEGMLRLGGEEIESERLVERWFESWGQFRHVIALVLADLWEVQRSTPELNFLTKVHAAEGFHRASERFRQEARTDNEHAQLLQAVTSAKGLTKQEREWVRARVRWNEVALRRRLTDLFKPLVDHFGIVFGTDRMGPFIESVVDTRNSLSHQTHPDNSDNSTDRVLRDVYGLAVHGELVGRFVRVHLLHELGLTYEVAAMMVAKIEAAQWAIYNYGPYLHQTRALDD